LEMTPHQLAVTELQLRMAEFALKHREVAAREKQLHLNEDGAAVRANAAAAEAASRATAAFARNAADCAHVGAFVLCVGLGRRASSGISAVLGSCSASSASFGSEGWLVVMSSWPSRLACLFTALLSSAIALALLPALLYAVGGRGGGAGPQPARTASLVLLFTLGGSAGERLIPGLGGSLLAWRLLFGALALAHLGAATAAEEAAKVVAEAPRGARRAFWLSLGLGLPALAAWLPFAV
jgi:hypothetical protein